MRDECVGEEKVQHEETMCKSLKQRENRVLRELVVVVIFLNFIYYGSKNS